MIYINNLKKIIVGRTLFNIDNLTINDEDKIGLIGNNGVGKTSLFRILAFLDNDYRGDFFNNSKINYLIDDYYDDNFSDEIYSKAKLKYGDKYSPGEFQRLRLIDLLKDSSSFLLIDEPTSHLDINMKEELIKRLNDRYIGYMVISHDRDFINRTCNKIIELEDQKLEIYNGNYSFYLNERIKRKKFQKREYDSYINEKNRLLNITNYLKDRSSKINKTPKRMGNSEARLHKMGGQENKRKIDNQIKSIESRIDHLEIKEKPVEEKPIKLSLDESDRIYSKILVREDNLNKSFSDKIIFSSAKFIIKNNSKVSLIGENGSGKTTLLNMIINREVWVHPNIKIGYYRQKDEILRNDKSILSNVLDTSIYDETLTRII